MWPFECIGPNGQTYLHIDNWKTFVKERETEYPHNWEHRRGLLTLCMPRDTLETIPGFREDTVINYVEDGFSTIFQPYPAHLRTGVDPDAKEPSFNLFVENGHVNPLGEKITLFSTGFSFFPNGLFGLGKPERFALYRDKYWRVWNVTGGGVGVVAPPVVEVAKTPKSNLYRSLDDDWE